MHLKRNKIGNFWPIPRKGTKYIAVPKHHKYSSVPLITMVRDILKDVKNKKELKIALNQRKILINQKEVRETNYPLCLFDTLQIKGTKENYKVSLSEKGKFILEKISEKETEKRPYKVINKKILSKNKQQLNLMNGTSIISKEKVKTGDTIILNLKDKKILKIISIKEKEKVFVIKGKHAGAEGTIQEIINQKDKQIAKIKTKTKKINVWIKNIIAIE